MTLFALKSIIMLVLISISINVAILILLPTLGSVHKFQIIYMRYLLLNRISLISWSELQSEFQIIRRYDNDYFIQNFNFCVMCGHSFCKFIDCLVKELMSIYFYTSNCILCFESISYVNI